MGATSGKLAGGLLLLIGVWVGVYWAWEPSRPPITLDRTGENVSPPPLMNVQRQAPVESDAKPTDRARQGSAEPGNTNAVKPPEFFDYIVKPGDTFESISKWAWGSAEFANMVSRVNPLGDAGRLLTPGRTIRLVKDPRNVQGIAIASPVSPLPVVPILQKNMPEVKKSELTAPPKQDPPKQEPTRFAAKGRTHTVQSGDNLSKIAKRYYDDPNQWERIYEANKGSMKAPHDLKVGAVLIIPE